MFYEKSPGLDFLKKVQNSSPQISDLLIRQNLKRHNLVPKILALPGKLDRTFDSRNEISFGDRTFDALI